uniref:Uncharacterized protein n=1 Tax=Nelumbo nucifera TaxID=4432 RepID=A0A822YKV7_NELNU|nr:TPA_asm: hypothetical protein HUJ06_011988 [Nelumbo nucifera]
MRPSCYHRFLFPSSGGHWFRSQTIFEPKTSDGLTVDVIVASDWKSHATTTAQSIQLIKKRSVEDDGSQVRDAINLTFGMALSCWEDKP